MAGALLALAATLLLLEAVFLLPHPALLFLIAVPLAFAGAGVVLMRACVVDAAAARPFAWLVGPALGLGFSVFGVFLLWAAGLQHWTTLLLAPGFTLALAWVARRTGGFDLRLPAMDGRDAAAVGIALLVVPLITWAPYRHVRAATPDGDAYRAYFTADFIWAMTVTSEIAKGDVPPANPFRYTEPMRYYWMSHLLSGSVYRTVQRWGIGSEPVVLVNGLAFGGAFVALLYWLTRAVGASPGWAAAMVIVGFVANSYEGADMIRAIVTQGDSWQRLRDTNIDAVTRWFYRGMAVDGLHRLLLYQPHHLTGYVFALSALWLSACARRIDAVAPPLWAGILLGLGFLFSTFAAIMLGVAVAIVFAVRLVQQRALSSALSAAVLGAGPVVVGVVTAQTLGYTNPDDGLLLKIGLNPVALTNVRWVLFSSFGPLIVIGLPALLLRRRWALDAGLAPAALVITALAFYFVTDVPDMSGVWVGWRSGHMLLIAFTATSAAALTVLWQRRVLRLPLAAGLLVAVVAALPTVAIDVYNAQDIDNRDEGAGFPWTLIVTPPERAALDWLRTETDPRAVVQVEPFVRDAGTWAYVPGFAERRMAVGLPISMIPLAPYRELSAVVRDGIFRDSRAANAHILSRRLGIDYLLFGREEQAAYPGQLERLAAAPDLFSVGYANEAVTILRVEQPGGATTRE